MTKRKTRFFRRAGNQRVLAELSKKRLVIANELSGSPTKLSGSPTKPFFLDPVWFWKRVQAFSAYPYISSPKTAFWIDLWLALGMGGYTLCNIFLHFPDLQRLPKPLIQTTTGCILGGTSTYLFHSTLFFVSGNRWSYARVRACAAVILYVKIVIISAIAMELIYALGFVDLFVRMITVILPTVQLHIAKLLSNIFALVTSIFAGIVSNAIWSYIQFKYKNRHTEPKSKTAGALN